jgi:hypothetical protein
MNGVWRKLWPDCVLDSQQHDTALASIPENVTEVAKETRLGAVEDGDVNEHPEGHGVELSTED